METMSDFISELSSDGIEGSALYSDPKVLISAYQTINSLCFPLIMCIAVVWHAQWHTSTFSTYRAKQNGQQSHTWRQFPRFWSFCREVMANDGYESGLILLRKHADYITDLVEKVAPSLDELGLCAYCGVFWD